MADQKLTALTEDTAPDPDDIVYGVSDPAGTPVSRKYRVRKVSPWVLIDDTTIGSPVSSVAHQFDPSLYSEVITTCRGVTVEVAAVDAALAIVASPLTSNGSISFATISRADSSDIVQAMIAAEINTNMGNGTVGVFMADFTAMDSQESMNWNSTSAYDSLNSTSLLTLTYTAYDPNDDSSLNMSAGRFTTYGLRLP